MIRLAHGRLALRLLLSLALPIMSLSLARRVQAQPSSGTFSAPSASDLESARALFKQGKDKRAAGDLKGALATFKAANALGQTPITALELARTHELLRELVEAREVALSVARMATQGDETERSVAARSDAAKLAEALKPRIATVVLHLVNVPADEVVTVSVDGAPTPPEAAALPRKVNPGHHTMTIAATGRADVVIPLDLAEAETRQVSLDLPPRTSPSTAARPSMEAPTKSGRSPLRDLVPIGIVAAGAGAIAGTITGISTLNRTAELRATCSNYQCTSGADKDKLAGARSTGAVSSVSFGVAAIGVGMIVIGLLSPRGDAAVKPATARAATLRMTPFVGAGEAGVHGIF